MGVDGLWPLVDGTAQHESLRSWRGRTLALDVSPLLVQAISALPNTPSLPQRALQLLFFRVAKLLQAGVRVVVVCDGPAPKLKDAAFQRRGYRLHGDGRHRPAAFAAECERNVVPMLRLLGVPCVRALGEAEATCAWLEQAGHVDATYGVDGDSLLFGSRTVIKNIEGCTMEVFRMAEIERSLGMGRAHLIALSLFTRSDYFDGINRVGPKCVQRFLAGTHFSVPEQVFARLATLSGPPPPPPPPPPRKPSHCSRCGQLGTRTTCGCAATSTDGGGMAVGEGGVLATTSTAAAAAATVRSADCHCAWHVDHRRHDGQRREHAFESRLREKVGAYCRRVGGQAAASFPPPDVVEAFLQPAVAAPPASALRPRAVAVSALAGFLRARLGWREEKATKHAFQTATRVHLATGQPEGGSGDPTPAPRAAAVAPAHAGEPALGQRFRPRVTKERTVQGEAMYVVEWTEMADTAPSSITTLEPRELLSAVYPAVVGEWDEAQASAAHERKFGSAMARSPGVRAYFSAGGGGGGGGGGGASAPCTPAKARGGGGGAARAAAAVARAGGVAAGVGTPTCLAPSRLGVDVMSTSGQQQGGGVARGKRRQSPATAAVAAHSPGSSKRHKRPQEERGQRPKQPPGRARVQKSLLQYFQ
jgi:hypothetical protein